MSAVTDLLAKWDVSPITRNSDSYTNGSDDTLGRCADELRAAIAADAVPVVSEAMVDAVADACWKSWNHNAHSFSLKDGVRAGLVAALGKGAES